MVSAAVLANHRYNEAGTRQIGDSHPNAIMTYGIDLHRPESASHSAMRITLFSSLLVISEGLVKRLVHVFCVIYLPRASQPVCLFLCIYLHACLPVTQELKNFLNRVGEVTFADAHKEHLNEGLDIHC